MTLRTLYRSTPLDKPLSLPRGWLILCAAVLSWLALFGVVQGLGMLLSMVTRATVFIGGGV